MLIFLLYNKSSVVAEMGDRLATINIGRIEGGCCAPFRGGELGGPIKHNVAWAEIYPVPPYQVASWSIQPFRHNRDGPKSGGAIPQNTPF